MPSEADEAMNRPARWRLPAAGVDRAAIVLVTVHMLVTCWALLNSSFAQDDFVILATAEHSGLTPDYIFQRYAGHAYSGGFLVAWLQQRLVPSSWLLSALFRLGLQLVASLLTWKLIRALFGRRPGSVVVFAVYTASNLTLAALAYWSASLDYVPLQVGFPAMLLLTKRAVARGGRAWVAPAAVLSGILLFFEKGVVVAGIVTLFVLLYPITATAGRTFRERLSRQWRGLSLTWIVAVAYGSIYLLVPPAASESASATVIRRGAARLVFSAFVPSLIGGPWRWKSHSSGFPTVDTPRPVAFVLRYALILGLVAVCVWVPRAIKAWGLVAMHLLITLILISRYRLGAFGEQLLSHPYYSSDTLITAILAIGVTTLGLHDVRTSVPPPRPSRRAHLAMVTGTSALVLSGLVSTARFVTSTAEMSGAPYFERLIETARKLPQPVVLLDQQASEQALTNLFAPRNNLSYLLPAFADAPAVAEVVPTLYRVATDGRVVRSRLDGTSSAELERDGEICVDSTTPITIKLDKRLPTNYWTVGVVYRTDRNVMVQVGHGPRSNRLVNLPAAASRAYFYDLEGSGSKVSLRVDTPDTRLCVAQLTIGEPVVDDA